VADQSASKQRGSKAHVLVVEDDVAVAKLVKSGLEHEGYGVSVVGTVAGLRAAIEAGNVDLVILDVMLPDEDGWSALRWIRARGEIPVLMLSGKDETVDKVVGLELGADDYLTKPFDLRELLARLRSIRRRAEPPSQAKRAADEVLRFPGWVLDLSSQRLTTEAGKVVHLTPLEYRILVLLVRNPRRAVTRDQLMAAATDRDREPLDRSIDVHVSNLRRKLDPDPALPSFIRTVRGAGYMFVPNRG
jgi:two-component system, OmpR family, response regulator